MSDAKTLLFLEDDKDLQTLVGAFLREKGYRVEAARTAAEARTLLSKMPVDAAIVDGLLPGVTGADFIRELRKTLPDLPVLFASAFWKDLKSHEMLTRQLKVARIIHKPYRPEELFLWVNQLFANKLPPPAGPRALADVDPVRDELAASLVALNAEYGARLKDKVEGLQKLLAEAREGNRESLEQASIITHKLHGTAGSYGFSEVSVAAGRLEDALRAGGDGARLDWSMVDVAFRELAATASVPVMPVHKELPSAVLPTEGVLLVVDEDAELLAEAEKLGRSHVVRVLSARTADEALELARKQWVDGVVIHMHLGGEMGGVQAAHLLRSAEGLGSLPLVFTGAKGGLEERVVAAHAGASLFLPRPFTGPDFVAAAERMVAARRPERARVLVVDDDPEAISALVHALASEQVEVVGLGDAHRLMEALAEHRPDLLLLDVQMPGPSGFDLCRILRSTPTWQDLPVLLITAHLGLEFRLAAFQAGADDYISKPVLREELRARVQARLERARLSKERVERDALTGLLTRKPFIEGMRARLSEARRQHRSLALCFLDVDHFKQVNDRYGHLAGDRVLARLGRLLGSRFRREDVRGRWGGEELVVGLLGETAASAKAIMSRTMAEVAQMTFDGDGGESFRVTLSVGIAEAPVDGGSLEDLLRAADVRLHRAKSNGRNRIEV